MPKNDPTVKIRRFLGVNNTEDPVDLGVDETGAGWLIDASNTDLSNAGKLQMRPGYAAVSGMDGSTSAFSTKEDIPYHVDTSGNLYRIDSMSPLVRTLLASGIDTGELYWAEAGNFVFFSGASKGIISRNDVLAFGIPTPEAPGLTAIGGSLPAGRYLAACLYRETTGREGGCAGISEIELTAAGGIAFDVPTIADHVTALYVSRVNGDVLFHLADVTSDYQWTAGGPSSLPLDEAQIGAYPPPDGADVIAFHESRIWVSEYDQGSNTSFIHPSKPFWYYLFPLDEYVPVPDRVLMLASVSIEGGAALLIGTDQAVHAYMPDGSLVELADYGVVTGHQVHVYRGRAYFWTEYGLCRAFPFTNLTNDSYSVPPGSRACVGVRRYGGMETLIISTDDSGVADNPRS